MPSDSVAGPAAGGFAAPGNSFGQVNRNPGLATHPGPASKILAGGRCPPDPPVFGWGGKAHPDPPLNGRSSHLIEAAKRGRLDQMIFFSAPLTIRAADDRPPTRSTPRSDRKKKCFFVLGLGSQAWVPINMIWSACLSILAMHLPFSHSSFSLLVLQSIKVYMGP